MNSLRFLCGLAAAALSTAPVSASLVAYWPFNSAASLGTDTAGGTVLTATGATWTAAGKNGGGLALSGSGQFLSGTVNNLPIGNSTYSQAAWFKPTALGPRGIVGWGNYGVTRQVNALRLFDNGNGFRHYWWGADLDATNLATNFLDGNWHHVATTYDGTIRRIYLDGVQVAQNTPGGVNGAAAANFRIGCTNNSEYFSGTLDDVSIYNHALTPAEVSALAAVTGPFITSFTVNKTTAYEGEAVTLNWSVDTSRVTGTFGYEINYGATTLTTGTSATGQFNTPVPDLAGAPQTVTWTLRAIETGGTNVTTTATVNLAGDPGIPSATGQSGLTTPVTSPLPITLTGTDPNGGTLSYTVVTQPGHGTLSGTGATRTYTPTPGIYGADQFTFKVSDGKYESPPATVLITVLTPPLAPTGITLDDQTIRPENAAGDFLSNISSPDPNAGEGHTFTLVSGAGSEENGNFTIAGHQLRANTSFATLTGAAQRIRIRSTDQAGLWIEAAFVLTVQPRSRGMVINEIHYNGSNNTVRNSFIELYNDGPSAVNLTGWRLSGGVDYLFPAGTTLAPDGYLLISEDPATMQSYYGRTALGPWDNAVIVYPDGSKESSGLSNDGDTVRLRDPSNNLVDEVDYSNHSPWPAEGNGEGSSIELIHPQLDNSHGSNWAAAKSAGGGPALATYVAAATSGWKYFKGTTAPSATWRNRTGADLTGWIDGTTTVGNATTPFFGFGYADNDDAPPLLSDMQRVTTPAQTGYQSVYFRKEFTIPAGQMPQSLGLRVYVDDGCIVYINGVEIPVRFYCSAGTPVHGADPTTLSGVTFSNHEAAPNNWDSYTITNVAPYNLVEGTNVIAILAANDAKTSSDFSFNLELKEGIAADVASPGVRNIKYSALAAPAIRNVMHTPKAPASSDAIVVTARITDPQGVASASVAYQIVTPGNYIPATLPKAVSGGAFVNVNNPLDPNPAFEAPANWTTIAMNDDGLGDDAVGGDGIWTATIPPQINRTLVRYRITCADNNGASARVPYVADPSLNFACFVYNGVPAYQGTPATELQKVPVYHLLTRQADYDQCVAYGSTNTNRLNGSSPSWQFENWKGTFVYDGVVYDHLPYRLKGANGRYWASGNTAAGNYAKRAFKFLFHKGYEFDAKDETGNGHPGKWSTLITENCWENRATYTFSLNEIVNFRLWNRLGVPAPLGNWAHFRTVMQTAEQPDAWHGDFWGVMYVHEDYDRRFLKAHNLKKGNLYKLTRDGTGGLVQYRYQSTFGVSDGTDHDELNALLLSTATAPTATQVTNRVNLDLWCRYHALAEAVRHYDYWPNGDNNAANYFYPLYNAGNNNKGVMWWLPNDVDATWGPTWNGGQDLIHNALFNDTGVAGGTSFTNPALWPNYFNQIREVRRLLWQPDQINPLLDEIAAIVRPLVNADFQRWVGGPNDAGNFGGLAVYGPSGTGALNLNSGVTGQAALDQYIAGMKDFAFDANGSGSAWPGGNISAGGTAARLDTIANISNPATGTLESAQYPATPTITYSGAGGFPVNDLRFTSSAFSDPNGSPFAAMQWRMAEVNASATYTAGVPRLLEITPTHTSAELAVFAPEYKYPATACEPGKRYRARVRLKDNTGRWSDWSNAAEFTAGSFDPSVYATRLVISEIMYHATGATAAERAVAAAQSPAQSWNDDSFDYIELRNVSAEPVDLTGFQFTAGVDFVFPSGTVINPGANVLIVANVTAFTTRYGAGRPVIGAWDENDRLSNGGEVLTLQFGLSSPPVFSFAYDDDPVTNWPTAADGDGPALVRIAPEDTGRDPGNGLNWRSGVGSPGADDRETFAAWSGGAAGPDTDNDGLSDIAEYMLGGNLTGDSSSLTPTGVLQTLTVNGTPDTYATITLRRAGNHEDFTPHIEFGTDLNTWPVAGVQVSAVENGDGSRTEVWRSAAPVAANSRLFGRVRFTQP